MEKGIGRFYLVTSHVLVNMNTCELPEASAGAFWEAKSSLQCMFEDLCFFLYTYFCR